MCLTLCHRNRRSYPMPVYCALPLAALPALSNSNNGRDGLDEDGFEIEIAGRVMYLQPIRPAIPSSRSGALHSDNVGKAQTGKGLTGKRLPTQRIPAQRVADNYGSEWIVFPLPVTFAPSNRQSEQGKAGVMTDESEGAKDKATTTPAATSAFAFVIDQRGILYDSDVEEACLGCPFRERDRGDESCDTCRHRSVITTKNERGQVITSEICSLAQSPLPTERWCCHYDADPIPTVDAQVKAEVEQRGGVVFIAIIHDDFWGGIHLSEPEYNFSVWETRYITLDPDHPLHPTRLLEEAEADAGVAGALREEAVYLVDPESLTRPVVYGIPTVHWSDAVVKEDEDDIWGAWDWDDLRLGEDED